MAPATSIYSWHPTTRGQYAFAIVLVALALGMFLATLSEPQAQPLILICTFAVVAVAVALLLDHDTRIDADARTVVRESRSLGGFCLWLSSHPFSEFTGVAMERKSYPDESIDTVFVGLRQRSGGTMWVCYFHTGVGKPSVEAERVGRSLADAIGLQLHEDVA